LPLRLRLFAKSMEWARKERQKAGSPEASSCRVGVTGGMCAFELSGSAAGIGGGTVGSQTQELGLGSPRRL
jgi:hypothetical protein